MADSTTSDKSNARRPNSRWRAAALVAALTAGALAVTGCGADDEASAPSSSPATATPTSTGKPSGTGLSEGAAGEATPEVPAALAAPDAVTTTPATESAVQPEPTPPPTSTDPQPTQPAAAGWTPPEGTTPGRCGGNGMDGRQTLNGWEVCWTEGTISPEFAVNVAQAVAANGFAEGAYQAESPTAGPQSLNCFRFNAPSSGTTIISCSGGTVTEGAAIELAWLG